MIFIEVWDKLEEQVTKTKVNVAMIGNGFMGRTHSNGYHQVNTFFDLPVEPIKKVLVARNPETAVQIKNNFNWQEVVSDWHDVITRPDIDVVDIVTPVHTHREIAVAAAKAGKAVICEKPLAGNLEDANAIAKAAEEAGVVSMCFYNLRKIPALSLAHQMIQQGLIGTINQWRGAFMQSWLVDPDFPLTWRLKKETAGSGALADLGSHSIDLARFLVGEIEQVTGSLHTFTKMRPIPVKDEGRFSKSSGKLGEVTVDDSAWAILQFESGAQGSMEATRMATGRLCANLVEIYGSEGGIMFDFTDMNHLNCFSLIDPEGQRGWRKINATDPVHPYMEAWWPPGHPLGYEHTFVHAMADFFNAFAKNESPTPDFRDAAKTQAVLEAIETSASLKTWVDVKSVEE